MKFAICNETFHDWPLNKGFQFARQCGYAGVEIAPFTIEKDVFDITSERRKQVRSQVEAAELEMIGLHWLLAHTEGNYLTSPDAEVRQRTGEYLSELARLCRDLGGHILVLGSPKQRNLLPGVSHTQAVQYAADVLRSTLPTLEDTSVVLAVEPLGPEEGDFLLTADAAAELINQVDSPLCRLHLDVKAMSSEPTPIVDIIRTHAGALEHFHANDANRRGPGMGQIDFIPILRTLQEVGYDGWVSVEVFDYTPGPEALALQSIQYLEKCLARLEED